MDRLQKIVYKEAPVEYVLVKLTQREVDSIAEALRVSYPHAPAQPGSLTRFFIDLHKQVNK